MPRLLLHVCCGPCSLMPIVHLREEGWDITAFFFNPNIHPQEEWIRRRDAMRQVAEALKVPLMEEGEPVVPVDWVKALGGVIQEGERCRFCYRPRMDRTALLAVRQGFDAFTSSLLYSRYQHHEDIRREAEEASNRYGAVFLYRDFRPWWWDGIAMSKELGIYRQKWCGCILSRKEALRQQEESARRKEEQKRERAARLAAEAEERRRRKEAVEAKRKLQKSVRSRSEKGECHDHGSPDSGLTSKACSIGTERR